MGTASSKNLVIKHGNSPDESRPFAAHGHADVHKLAGGTVMRAVFEPGWKWSTDIQPLAGTKTCQAPHLGFVLSGRMKIRMDDGYEDELTPGDFFKINPGHDAWVVGSEPCVMVDFAGYDQYAKPVAATSRADERTAEPLGAQK